MEEHDIGIPRVKIEHIRPQSVVDEEYSGLDYYNIVAVCNGNAAKKMRLKYLTCDAHKGDRILSKVNPLKPEMLETIYYTSDGRIGATDLDVNDDLTVILNLNSDRSHIVSGRKNVMDAIDEGLEGLNKSEIDTFCRNLLEDYEKEKEIRRPFVGVAEWYLKDIIVGIE